MLRFAAFLGPKCCPGPATLLLAAIGHGFHPARRGFSMDLHTAMTDAIFWEPSFFFFDKKFLLLVLHRTRCLFITIEHLVLLAIIATSYLAMTTTTTPSVAAGDSTNHENDDSGSMLTRWRRTANKNRRSVGTAVATAIACLVLGIVLAVTLTSNSTSPSKNATVAASSSSSTTNDCAPTTSSPFLDTLWTSLPVSNREQIRTTATPQQQAWDWLSGHPGLSDFEDWRKQQLFALATVSFALSENDTSRLDRMYTVPECQWFSEASECSEENGEMTALVWNDILVSSSSSIPPEVSLLTKLQVLSINDSPMNTNLDTFLPWDTLPEMTSLTQLSLMNNDFVGTLPTELAQMTQLTEVFLRINPKLTGRLPTEWAGLTHLEKFNLGRCGLTGTIPSEYAALTKLADRSIWLEENNLTGSIPTEIGAWSNLGLLLWNGNALTGTIPSQIQFMTGLEEMSLYENALTGTIPSEMGLLTSTTKGLARVYLYNNSLTGPIPSELGALYTQGDLQGLRLSHNQLTGTVPEELCAMGQIQDPSDWWEQGLLFDCNDKLCGCTWCPCDTN